MTPPPIEIPDALRTQMYAHALQTFPEECCGYLCGPRGAAYVDTVVRCRNAQADGEHPLTPARGADTGFVISGAELLRFAKSFDGERPARVVYHSHTRGRAYFSAVDQAMAAGPAYPVQHLVLGVDRDAIGEVAQFAWSEGAGAYVEIARWRP